MLHRPSPRSPLPTRPAFLHCEQRRQLLRRLPQAPARDRKSTRLNSSHGYISYAVFCLKKKKTTAEYSSAFSDITITQNQTRVSSHATFENQSHKSCDANIYDVPLRHVGMQNYSYSVRV